MILLHQLLPFSSPLAGELLLLHDQNLDYETIPWKEYTLTVIVGDGMVTTNPVNLTLEIIDVNEPPVFTEKIYYVSTNEGPVSIHQFELKFFLSEILISNYL